MRRQRGACSQQCCRRRRHHRRQDVQHGIGTGPCAGRAVSSSSGICASGASAAHHHAAALRLPAAQRLRGWASLFRVVLYCPGTAPSAPLRLVFAACPCYSIGLSCRCASGASVVLNSAPILRLVFPLWNRHAVVDNVFGPETAAALREELAAVRGTAAMHKVSLIGASCCWPARGSLGRTEAGLAAAVRLGHGIAACSPTTLAATRLLPSPASELHPPGGVAGSTAALTSASTCACL